MNDWQQVVEEQSRPVFSIAFRILGRIHDAEDVSQDVFCEAYRLYKRGSVTDLPGILRRLATLRSLDRLRSLQSGEPISKELLAGSGSSPSEIAESTELHERLRRIIVDLPERQAEIFTMICFEEMSRDEVANSLQISAEAVSSALYKARRKIERLLLSERTEVNYERERT